MTTDEKFLIVSEHGLATEWGNNVVLINLEKNSVKLLTNKLMRFLGSEGRFNSLTGRFYYIGGSTLESNCYVDKGSSNSEEVFLYQYNVYSDSLDKVLLGLTTGTKSFSSRILTIDESENTVIVSSTEEDRTQTKLDENGNDVPNYTRKILSKVYGDFKTRAVSGNLLMKIDMPESEMISVDSCTEVLENEKQFCIGVKTIRFVPEVGTDAILYILDISDFAKIKAYPINNHIKDLDLYGKDFVIRSIK